MQGRITLTRGDAATLRVTALDGNGYPVRVVGTAARFDLAPDIVYYRIGEWTSSREGDKENRQKSEGSGQKWEIPTDYADYTEFKWFLTQSCQAAKEIHSNRM